MNNNQEGAWLIKAIKNRKINKKKAEIEMLKLELEKRKIEKEIEKVERDPTSLKELNGFKVNT